jgi:hypothetical protein
MVALEVEVEVGVEVEVAAEVVVVVVVAVERLLPTKRQPLLVSNLIVLDEQTCTYTYSLDMSPGPQHYKTW